MTKVYSVLLSPNTINNNGLQILTWSKLV